MILRYIARDKCIVVGETGKEETMMVWFEIPWKTQSSSQAAEEDEITIMWKQRVISKQQRMKCSKVTTNYY